MTVVYRLTLVDHTEPDVAEDISDLDKIIFNDGSPNLEIENVLSWPRHWWIAYIGDAPIGYCSLSYGRTPGFGFLSRAGVLPEHRGRGLQPRMIRARERKARLIGLNVMTTDTAYFNIRSSNNLIKAGYRLYKPEQPWSFDTSLYWRKHLQFHRSL